MRFFITVFPQRNVKEYFDFTEAFMDKNKGLSNYSVLEALEQSIMGGQTKRTKDCKAIICIVFSGLERVLM